jgi:hypothetical protein
MTFYSDMAQTALDMLTEFGQPIVLRKFSQGGGDYNPATGIGSPKGRTGSNDYTRSGLIVDAPGNKTGPQYGVTFQVGTLIQDTDKWMYMDAIGLPPKPQDHVIVQGIEFTLIDFQQINPAGTPVIYLLIMRV